METLREAIERIQRMRDEASAYFEENDVPGGWLDEHGSWKDWESEAEGSAAEAEVQTLDRVLDVLQALAHGLTPEQGSTLRQDIAELDRAADRGEPPYAKAVSDDA